MAITYEETSKKLEVFMKMPPSGVDTPPVQIVEDTIGGMIKHCLKGHSFEIWEAEWSGPTCLYQYNKLFKDNSNDLLMTEDDLKNMYERVQKGWERNNR